MKIFKSSINSMAKTISKRAGQAAGDKASEPNSQWAMEMAIGSQAWIDLLFGNIFGALLKCLLGPLIIKAAPYVIAKAVEKLLYFAIKKAIDTIDEKIQELITDYSSQISIAFVELREKHKNTDDLKPAVETMLTNKLHELLAKIHTHIEPDKA